VRRRGVYLGPLTAVVVILAGWGLPHIAVELQKPIEAPTHAASRLHAASETRSELGPLFGRVTAYEVAPDGLHPASGRVEWHTLFGLPAGTTTVPGTTDVRIEMIALGWALLVTLEAGAAAWFVLGPRADDL
jgi:hypothetical protein